MLGLDWSVVHEEADALEHAVSDRVIERIDLMLGHPTADPHGDPIPTPKGHIEAPHRTSLADCPLKQSVQVSRVLDQSPEFLRFVEKQGLTPGAVLTVKERETVSGVVQVRIAGRENSSLGLAAAAKVLVEQCKEIPAAAQGKCPCSANQYAPAQLSDRVWIAVVIARMQLTK